MTTTRISVNMPESLKQAIERRASDEQLDLSAFILQAVTHYLEQRGEVINMASSAEGYPVPDSEIEDYTRQTIVAHLHLPDAARVIAQGRFAYVFPLLGNAHYQIGTQWYRGDGLDFHYGYAVDACTLGKHANTLRVQTVITIYDAVSHDLVGRAMLTRLQLIFASAITTTDLALLGYQSPVAFQKTHGNRVYWMAVFEVEG